MGFRETEARDGVAYLAHTVSRTGTFLSREAGIREGEPLAYLIAPPVEAMTAMDAALKAADVRLAKLYEPPSETNFGGGLLTGTQSACRAACEAFAAAVEKSPPAPNSPKRLYRRGIVPANGLEHCHQQGGVIMDQDLASRQEARELGRRAEEAQKTIRTFSQEKLDAIVQAVSRAFLASAGNWAAWPARRRGLATPRTRKLRTGLQPSGSGRPFGTSGRWESSGRIRRKRSGMWACGGGHCRHRALHQSHLHGVL